MKRLTTIILLFVAFTINAQKPAYNSFYNDNKENSKFSMGISGDTMGNFFSSDKEAEEFEDLVKKAKHCKIMVFSNDNNKTEKNFRKFAKSNKLQTLVKIKEGKDRAEIYFREKGNLIKEIIIKANSDSNQFVMVGLKISLTKDELSEIVASVKK